MVQQASRGQPASATRPAAAATAPVLPPQFDEFVGRGLEYLAKHQADDGSIGDETDRVVRTAPVTSPTSAPATAPATALATSPATTPTTAATTSPAIAPTTTPATAFGSVPTTTPSSRRHLMTTATALLAFLSSGNAPDVGRHGFVVSSSVDFLLDHVPDDGYAGAVKGRKGDDSGMVGQGVVAVALAEAYGVEQGDEVRTRIRRTLAKMLPVILAAQLPQSAAAHAGGWGVAPDANASDLTATTWNVLAMCACRDIGYDIPEPALRAASDYFARRRNADKGFGLQPASPSDLGVTAAAIVCLSAMRTTPEAELAEAKRMLVALRAKPPANASTLSNYLVCQAVADDEGEAVWRSITLPSCGGLLKAQVADGGWPAGADPGESSRVHATAMAVLTLSTTYRLLPLYAR